MKDIFFTRICFAIFLSIDFTVAQGQENPTYAITDVTVIPMDREGSLAHQTVIVKGGKILQLGDSRSIIIPRNTTIIPGKDKFLIPGLVDMHAHFFYEQGRNVNTCEEELKVMLANGLTTARIICGDSVYLHARKMVKEGKWIGPELVVTSPQFVGSWPWKGKVFAAVCKTPQDAEQAVKKFKQQGYDEIKITFNVDRPVYDAIITAAKEENIKVTGHVGPKVKLPRALETGQQIEHMDEFIDMLLPDTSFNHGQSVSDMNLWRKRAWETVDHLDERKIPALVRMVKEARIFVTPTNYFFFSSFGHGLSEEEIKHRPDYQYIPAAIKEERWMIRERYWNNAPTQTRRDKYVALRKQMTKELWLAGVKLMAGSDSPEWFLVQGFSIHDELETFVKAGLTPFAALQTATVNPALYLGSDKRMGSISVGKDASLILLEKDPLADIRNTRTIAGVFCHNMWYDHAAIDSLLEQGKVLAK